MRIMNHTQTLDDIPEPFRQFTQDAKTSAPKVNESGITEQDIAFFLFMLLLFDNEALI